MAKTASFRELNLKYHDFRICVEIPIIASRQNMNYQSIPSYERSRLGGKKKVSPFKDGLLILLALVKLLFYKKK